MGQRVPTTTKKATGFDPPCVSAAGYHTLHDMYICAYQPLCMKTLLNDITDWCDGGKRWTRAVRILNQVSHHCHHLWSQRSGCDPAVWLQLVTSAKWLHGHHVPLNETPATQHNNTEDQRHREARPCEVCRNHILPPRLVKSSPSHNA